jgi:hypothetical protein
MPRPKLEARNKKCANGKEQMLQLRSKITVSPAGMSRFISLLSMLIKNKDNVIKAFKIEQRGNTLNWLEKY